MWIFGFERCHGVTGGAEGIVGFAGEEQHADAPIPGVARYHHPSNPAGYRRPRILAPRRRFPPKRSGLHHRHDLTVVGQRLPALVGEFEGNVSVDTFIRPFKESGLWDRPYAKNAEMSRTMAEFT